MMTQSQADKIIDEVSALVGGEDRGMFAFVLRIMWEQHDSADAFTVFAIKMLEKTYGVLPKSA